MPFVQTIEIDTDDIGAVTDLVSKWHADQAGVAPGYQRARILADEERRRHYIIEVDFASKKEAETNNARPETGAWAERLGALTDGSPTFRNLALVHATG